MVGSRTPSDDGMAELHKNLLAFTFQVGRKAALDRLLTLANKDEALRQERRFVEGRKKGQRAGAQANRRRAADSRAALIRLARPLLERKPDLRTNLSRMVREIRSMEAQALKQAGVSHLGDEAMRKHLSNARRDGLL